LVTLGEPSTPLPHPVPGSVPGPVRHGPRVRLPNRDYLLYTGPAEAVLTTDPLPGAAQAANLWWPADRAWCVASEVDLAWSYVGGPAGLVEPVLADHQVRGLAPRHDHPGTPV